MAELYNRIEFKFAGTYKSDITTNKALSLGELNSQSSRLKESSADEVEHKIALSWAKVNRIGPGLENAGNTCFLNSVLQSLTYCPPLANYLCERTHSNQCRKHFEKDKSAPYCVLCAFEEHVNRCFASSKPILPAKIIKNLRSVAPRFRLGRQEDSHEFLRMLIDGMQKSALFFKAKPDLKIQESTPIYRIFGGKLKSQVKCLTCNYCSEIFETIYDLSLDMKGCESLEKSLEAFFKIEELHGENKYRCSKCKILVNAHKRFLLWKSPKVLTVHLKRFSNALNKINKFLSFPPTLNMAKFVTTDNNVKNVYDLFAVLVHSGSQIWSGHYYCYVKNSNNIWYQMNDESVSTVDFKRVLDERAYILFYVMREDKGKDVDASKNPRKNSKEILTNQTQGTNLGSKIEKEPEKQVKTLVNSAGENKIVGAQTATELLEKSKKNQDYMSQFSEIFRKKTKTTSTPAPTQKPETIPIVSGKAKVNDSMKNSQAEKPSQNGNEGQKRLEKPIIGQSLAKANSEEIRPKKPTVFDLLSKSQSQEITIENNLELPKITPLPLINSKRRKLCFLQLITNLKRPKVERKLPKTFSLEEETPILEKTAQQTSENSIQLIKAKPIKSMISLEEYLGGEEPEGWEEEGSKLKEYRKSLMEQNKEFFEFQQREKDEYDKEYDKGKVKKVRKRKERKEIDFDALSRELKTDKKWGFQNRNSGNRKFKKNKRKFKHGKGDPEFHG